MHIQQYTGLTLLPALSSHLILHIVYVISSRLHEQLKIEFLNLLLVHWHFFPLLSKLAESAKSAGWLGLLAEWRAKIGLSHSRLGKHSIWNWTCCSRSTPCSSCKALGWRKRGNRYAMSLFVRLKPACFFSMNPLPHFSSTNCTE